MPDDDKLQVIEVATPSPIFRGAAMVRALEEYRELQKALDKSMPDQLMTLGDKQFRKKGYWRAISVAFNLNVECVREERNVYGTLPDGADNYIYSVVYQATTPSGRVAAGDGTCAASEKQRGRMEATEHNVRSHAHTRAFNRAISNLVAFGEVSAEEVERDEHSVSVHQQPSEPARPDGAVKVKGIEQKSGNNNRTGKAWTSFTVTFSDGKSLATFDTALAAKAKRAQELDVLVVPRTEQNGKYVNLVGLDLAEDAPEPDGDERGEIINEEGQGKLWKVAGTHGWNEGGVLDLLKKYGYAGTNEVRTGDWPKIMQDLKQGRRGGEGQ